MLNKLDGTEHPISGVRDRQRAEVRRRLLSSALDEFLVHGFVGASTRRITEAAGVSHGLLFHNFGSKAELYLALVRLGSAEVAIDVETVVEHPLEFFSDTAERMLTMLREQPRTSRMFVFMDYVASHPGLVPEVDAIMGEHDVVLRSTPVVEAGQNSGEIRQGSAQALAMVFWAALLGVAREAFTDPNLDLPESEWLLDVLRTKTTS